jgi:hypothetical protein
MRLFPAGLFAVLSSLTVLPAQAQLLLPGAAAATSPTSETGGHQGGAGKPKPITVKVPNEATLIGRELVRDGLAGSMAFERTGQGLEVSKLAMKGEQISNPAEPCRVDVVAARPLATKFLGRPVGLSRYEIELQACPLSFDVLDGAVLVSGLRPFCDFVAADCRVQPNGLWGPPGNTINGERVKEMEKALVRAENDMRANFRALLAKAGKDRASVKAIAGEQAGFSSDREMICRDYARESTHGFCALRITEARNLALQAKLGSGPKGEPEIKPVRSKHKPVAPVAVAPGNE